jgi:hypothetical protein
MSLYERAELLAALWKLGAPDQLLPTSHGILDKALSETFEVLPHELQDGLTFRVSSVGLRSYELPDILLAAQEALLTSEPNPTYLKTVVTLDEDSARQIVLGYGISTAEARKIGGRIAEAVSKIEGTMQRASPLVAA